MGGVAAEADEGGTGEEEEEGDGQTPAGKLYEHWYVDRPPRVRSSRMAENDASSTYWLHL